MARPFVSVVVNNYNYGRFLKEALDSVLNQDFSRKDFEVLVVDDGSTDDSRENLEQFKREEIRSIFQKNQGQAAAISLGIAEARGEIVCLLDSDDVWKSQKISSVAPLFDDPWVGGVQHHLEDVNASLTPLPRGPFPHWPTFYSLDDFLEGRCEWTATSGMAFRKSALKRATPIPSEIFYCLDHFLAVGALLDSNIANIPRVLGSHRSHGDNWYFGAMADKKNLNANPETKRLSGLMSRYGLARAGKKQLPLLNEKKSGKITARYSLPLFRSSFKASPRRMDGRAWAFLEISRSAISSSHAFDRRFFSETLF